ncbi:sulfatase [Pelagicoccus mobilis]|uniref:Sulfatase n=1 Tax=Pelagicoccus mobilis TaxID=415221 RepID=A0A934RYV6_9BACT|nr:sulfatase [Pelagicoccus mobilis]MBK1877799.1 sulfatase [Pelagicoccus mobilis]
MKIPLILICVLLSAASMRAERLNVVFFLVDDLGYHDLSLTGSEVYETPNVDQLAADGALLTQAYAAFPRCVPSRYAMISGVHPSRAESEGERLTHMSLERVTIAEALKDHGYTTFFAGKWHLGKSEDRYPSAQGFDVSVGAGSAGAPGTYIAPYTAEKNLSGPEVLNAPQGEYLTDRLTDETIGFIEQNGDEPFFVYLSHYGVHTPLEGKSEKVAYYEKKIEGIGFESEQFAFGIDGRRRVNQDNAIYAAMIESVDESLGRIVECLEKEGLSENTIVIFTSDHGGLSNSGSENKRPLATSNSPLRAGKGHMYEGGTRVPVVVKWPGRLEGGKSLQFPITGMDYFPTILEMLDLPQRPDAHVDGESFVPGLLGRESFNEDRSFFWYSDTGRRRSTGDFNAAVLRKGKYKLMQFFTEDKVELYDLSLDVGEDNDLSNQLPEVRSRMLEELIEWKKSMSVRDKQQSKKRDY